MTNLPAIKAAAWIITAVGIGFLLVIGKEFLVPIILAVLFAFLIYPLTHKLEQKGIPRILANLLVLLLAVAIVVGLIALFSFLVRSFIADVPALKENVMTNLATTYQWFNETLSIPIANQQEWVASNLNLERFSGSYLRQIFSTTTSTLLSVGLTFVYTFFFLYYRDKFRTFLFKMTPHHEHSTFRRVVQRISNITPRYLFGILIVVAILAVLNSIGFAIVGVNNPIFFGVLAAILNIIPYLGTILGYVLVFIVTMATQSIPIALGVLILFFIIQFTENNILTPNITAGQVKLNPLIAILSVVLGGVLWGFVGMLIVIPLLGMVKIICENIEKLKPVAYLLGTEGTEQYALTTENIKKRFKQWFGSV